MAQKRTDKDSYTIVFAVVMVVIVGVLLATVYGSLKDKIKQNQKVEKMQNILFAMGINESTLSGNEEDKVNMVPADQTDALFNKYIKEQYQLEGTLAKKNDKAYLIDIKKESDKAKANSVYSRKLPLFIGEKDGEKLFIVPVRGNGLWDAIWGYITLEGDFNTIAGAFFDHKGETPGLGSNITAPFFYEDFVGEKIKDASGVFKGVAVAKGNADPENKRKNDNKVDAIAGATITGDGVAKMIKVDLGLYQPYFNSLTK